MTPLRASQESTAPADLAQHDGVAVIPARAAKPRDQAKVDVGVPVVERWMLARLRHHTCFSLAEVNAALLPLLSTLNASPFKKLPGSHQELLDTRDRPALWPLPAPPYASEIWVLVALFVGAEIFGFLGVLLAVPAAAVVNIFVTHGVQYYCTTALSLPVPPASGADRNLANDEGLADARPAEHDRAWPTPPRRDQREL